MSTTRNSIKIFENSSEKFIHEFDFYLDALDEIYHYQSAIGLTPNELASLPELDQNVIKSFLFLVESANTTSIGALRLFSSNLFSDSYSLIRILYEIGCLMHYGNISIENKKEIYFTIFKSGLSEKDHRRNEWKLIQKAERKTEELVPGLIPIRNELNNFGGHISKSKIFLGNVSIINSASVSKLFTSNFHNRFFLKGLDLLYSTSLLLLEEYLKHLKCYKNFSEFTKREIEKLASKFAANIRPRLQSFIDPKLT